VADGNSMACEDLKLADLWNSTANYPPPACAASRQWKRGSTGSLE
jgi:hypothetical protein